MSVEKNLFDRLIEKNNLPSGKRDQRLNYELCFEHYSRTRRERVKFQIGKRKSRNVKEPIIKKKRSS